MSLFGLLVFLVLVGVLLPFLNLDAAVHRIVVLVLVVIALVVLCSLLGVGPSLRLR